MITRRAIHSFWPDGDGSTLSLDFTTGVLDPRLTFTRSTSGTYIGADGLVKTMAAAPTNDPTKARFDYDPTTLAPRGLLIEGSAKNLVFRSQQLNTSPWLNAGTMTVSETGSGSPANDATSNVVTWTNGTAAGNAWLRQSVPVSAGSLVVGSAYTWSVWLKARGNQRVAFWAILQGASGNREVRVDFSVSPPTVTSVAATGWTAVQAPSIQEFPNGWYRVTTGGTIPASTTGVFFGFSNSDAVPASGTNGFEAWGYQLEDGSGASSYIPTGASQGSRVADNCYIYDTTSSGGLSWFKTATQGTFYVEMFKRTAGTAFGAAGFGTRANSLQEFMLYQAVGNNWLSFNWGAGEYVTNYSALSSPFLIKAAVALSPSTPATEADSTVSINGSNSALNTGPNIALPFTSDLFCIGSRGPASGTAPSQNYAETAIRRIKFFPFAMTAAQMNAITTL